MEIKNLKHTPFREIVDCLLESFSDYYLPMPTDISYWKNRFEAGRVDYELAFGMFGDDGVLKGFIINGIDNWNGIKTAFNIGTGVVKNARGHKVVDQLYMYAFSYFKNKGVGQCLLEVIQQNEKAIHVYERIGFNISRQLLSFRGTINPDKEKGIVIPSTFENISRQVYAKDHSYSWENTGAAIKAAEGRYKCYEVYDGEDMCKGYFVINPVTSLVVQFEATAESALPLLLSCISTVTATVKINNVDSRRREVIDTLKNSGLENFINQYEMQMILA